MYRPTLPSSASPLLLITPNTTAAEHHHQQERNTHLEAPLSFTAALSGSCYDIGQVECMIETVQRELEGMLKGEENGCGGDEWSDKGKYN